MHDEADKTYAENVKKWEVVDKCIKDWILKMEALVKMWTDQAGKEYKETNLVWDSTTQSWTGHKSGTTNVYPLSNITKR